MLPIYIGAEGEENQGLCTGSENFWCVNNTSSDEDIQATLDFLYWCVTSEAGTSAMADKMGFVIPFKAAKDSTNPSSPSPTITLLRARPAWTGASPPCLPKSGRTASALH